jgi:integrase
MKNVADTNRLLDRNGVWYYYRRVPPQHVATLGKRFVKESLGTKDKAEAKKRRTICDLKWDATFDGLDQPVAKPNYDAPDQKGASSFEQMLSYVREAVRSDDDRHAATYFSDAPETFEQLENMRQEAETVLSILNSPDDVQREELIALYRAGWLAKKKLPDDPSPNSSSLWRRGLIELNRRKLARYHDDFAATYYDEIFSASDTAPKITVTELLAIYREETISLAKANGLSAKWRDKQLSLLPFISESVGATTPISNIDDEVVQRFRLHLAKLPARRNLVCPGLPLNEAISKGAAENLKTLSAVTQQVYLESFKGFLKLAVRKKLLSFNPADGLKPLKKNTVAAEERRLPLSPEQLRGFFESTFYRSCGLGSSEPYTAPDRQWRFWLPLIMLFSGARPNEIAQLRVQNIKQTPSGTFFLDLKSEHAGQTIAVKTQSSRRRIPVHTELLKFGFAEYVSERSKEGAGALLFPTLKADKSGNWANYACKRLTTRYMPEVIELGKRQSLYSLRHNVRDALRRVEAPPAALSAIAGWSPAGGQAVSDHYGDPSNPDHFIAWVNRIAYPGLDLSFLYRG